MRRVETLMQKRSYVKKLARALLLQQQILEENLTSMILASGCEDATSITQDPLGYFRREEIQEQVEEYLGSKNYIVFTDLIKECNKTIEGLARNISGLVPALKEPTDDLVAIINRSQEKANLAVDLAPRVKLLLGITDIKSTIKDIDANTNALERFSRLVISNRPIIQSPSSRAAVKLSRALRHIRTFAGSLYTAILEGFQQQEQSCHEQHETRLYLDDRVDLAPDLLRRIGNDSIAESPLMCFEVVFTASLGSGNRVFYETPVQVFGNSDGNGTVNIIVKMNQIRQQESRPRHSWMPFQSLAPPSSNSDMTLTIPPSSPSRSRSPSPTRLSRQMVVSVANICTELTKAKAGERRVSFALVSNNGEDGDKDPSRRGSQIGIIDDDTNPVKELSGVSTISLGELLAEYPRSTAPLSWKLRMRLALRLASSLLQLMQTSWLSHGWSKDLVFFLATPPLSGNKFVKVDLDRPFVTRAFDGKPRALEGDSGKGIEPKAMLLELGILLLEIWHCRTLENRFGLKAGDAPTSYYDRMARTVEWLDDAQDPLPDLYERAVAHCIRVNIDGDSRFLNWEDTKLWDVICGDIIEPLSKICKQWS
ncbi:hypothetical protein GQ53DRAFT_119164 [Thozetella sp. PMI_491]|nr:hypothetical protein GQ53DRAFT_119164 [Thozetella sp. PMI_491]